MATGPGEEGIRMRRLDTAVPLKKLERAGLSAVRGPSDE
jgi:hypothetical protein